jgi:hypothetical protein
VRGEQIVRRVANVGAGAQAIVPGIYAWGVTVAPAAWSRGGAPLLAKIAAVAALAALLLGLLGDRYAGGRLRVLSLWGFVLGCALSWSATPTALGPLRMDVPQAAAGMIGWALFTLASAAPSLQRSVEPTPIDADLGRGRRIARIDAGYILLGTVLAAAPQLVGWRVANAERSLLVRFTALSAGLAILGAAASIALARHAPRGPRAASKRMRGAFPTLVVLAVLGFAGVLFVARG